MYKSRSETNRLERVRRKRRTRNLIMLNIAMLLILGGFGAYYVMGLPQDNQQAAKSVDGTPKNTIPTAPEGDGKDTSMPDKQPEDGAQDGAKDSNDAGETSALPSSGDVLKLAFVGDIQMSGKVDDLMRKNGYDFPFVYAKDYFRRNDLTIGNLETPITEGGTAATDKQFVFKSSPKSALALKEAGIDAVSLANNHVLDHGVKGLLDTVDHLDEAKVVHVGGGKDEDSAYEIAYMERKGIKVALLGFSRVVPNVSWKASGKHPGVAETYSSTKAVAKIEEARKHADLVIVMVHWGIEKADLPNAVQKSLARQYVDAGADLVIGSHPHVLQSVEQYNGKWIAYSLGNFIFTRASQPKTWETGILEASCARNGKCSLELIPFHAELGQAVPMDEETGKKLLKRISDLSTTTVIGSDGTISVKTKG